MMQQLWKSFPRQLEQRVNGLLEHGEPNSAKAFQLYKSCQQENIWSSDFANFSQALTLFFSKARGDRHKSEIDRHLDRPMDAKLYEEFHLTFRTAEINATSVRDIASWAHHVLRVGGKIDTATSSIGTLNEVLLALTRPAFFEKDIDIEFSDFCDCWQKIVTDKLGLKITVEVTNLFAQLSQLDQQSKNYDLNSFENVNKTPNSLRNPYNFTPSERHWVHLVNERAKASAAMPKQTVNGDHEGWQGPQKIQLIELERIVTLYQLVRLSDRQELLRHRDSIRVTLLDRCRLLLG